ncbi:MAG: ABC transporter permease subunit [Verrucomicrobiota bacterium]|nr:ABC transporter permease subunit [Verrucomicrobiota bacterium]
MSTRRKLSKILTIAGNTLRLIFRGGAGIGTLFILILVGIFIFSAAKADEVLINEIRLRFRYSLYFSTTILSMATLWFSCVTVRKDIDGKQMHALVSFPISRVQIWIGKWLGIFTFASIALFCCILTSGLCALVFTMNWENKTEITEMLKSINPVYSICQPEGRSVEIKVDIAYSKLKATGKLPPNETETQIRKNLFLKFRREEQLLPAGTGRTWEFNLKKRPQGKSISFRYKFYTQRRKKLAGKWIVETPGKIERYEVKFNKYPYRIHTAEIPVSMIPKNNFTVSFIPITKKDIIFPGEEGLRVYYKTGTILGNATMMFFLFLLHLGTVVALGLTFGTVFTFSVATFVSLIFYFLGMGSSFFENIANNTMNSEEGTLHFFSNLFLCIGVWLTKGISPSPVIGPFSENLSVSAGLQSWLPELILYFLVVAIIGMIFLSRKELDRLH